LNTAVELQRRKGYTHGMKTAISIPDDIFEKAERLAKRTRKSRSQLFSDAIKEYMARHTPEEITETMNRIIDEIGETTDSFISLSSKRVLEKTEW
jgi:metal-responsive CopG/Arc/MetJ family transcriptional regulator